MPGGKENKNPQPGDAKADSKDAGVAASEGADDPEKNEKKKGGKRDHAEPEDNIGPGDTDKGVAAVGWKLPCKCSVLQGKYGGQD